MNVLPFDVAAIPKSVEIFDDLLLSDVLDGIPADVSVDVYLSSVLADDTYK